MVAPMLARSSGGGVLSLVARNETAFGREGSAACQGSHTPRSGPGDKKSPLHIGEVRTRLSRKDGFKFTTFAFAVSTTTRETN